MCILCNISMNKTTNAPLTREEFEHFMSGFTNDLNEAFANFSDSISQEFIHIYKRLDDIDRRLEKLERRVDGVSTKVDSMGSDVHNIKNETKLITPIFELTRMDGHDIGELKLRVGKLETQS